MLKKIIKNDFLIGLFVKAISIITGFVSTVFLNRFLGVTVKGEYSYYINLINIWVVILNFGLSTIYSMAKRNKMENVKSKFYNLAYIEFFIITLVFIIYYFLNRNNNISIWVCILLSTSNIFNQLNIFTLIDDIRYRQKINIFISLYNAIATFVVFLLFESNVDIAYEILFIKDFIAIIAFILKSREKVKISIIDKEFLLFVLKNGFPAMIASLLLTFNYKVDSIFIMNMLGSYDNGIYSVAIALTEYCWLIADSFKEVLQNKTAKDDSLNAINFSISINMLIAVAYIITFNLLGKFLIKLLYGNEYVGAYDVTNVLLLGTISMIIFKLTAPLYLARGKQKFYLFVLFLSALANILLNTFLIPLYKLYGAAIASVVSYNICGLIFYFKYIRDYKLKWYNPMIAIFKYLRRVLI